jgi:hypothetical protein
MKKYQKIFAQINEYKEKIGVLEEQAVLRGDLDGKAFITASVTRKGAVERNDNRDMMDDLFNAFIADMFSEVEE